MNTPAYLPELKSVFADKKVKNNLMYATILRQVNTFQKVGDRYGEKWVNTEIRNGWLRFECRADDGRLICAGTHNNFLTVYGSVSFEYREGVNQTDVKSYLTSANGLPKTFLGDIFWKVRRGNGIEVLGMRPYATGSTYSNVCHLTIPQLRAACKMNGITKTTGWKKVDFLRALQKV